ncbi:MAG: type II secretion system major pseudopilin GspG [Lentisphaeria bacterium]|nr:type II secretion system major pseudopilin GspG [Lentisphaeria bacterium]
MEIRRRKRRRSFTLIEIMVVVVIIGMILGLVGPAVMGMLGKAKTKNARSQTKLLKDTVNAYYLDCQTYPARLADLLTNPGDDKWAGPYMTVKNIPKDPWGEDYLYDIPGQETPFDIYSYGADKAQGGKSNDTDVSCWDE